MNSLLKKILLRDDSIKQFIDLHIQSEDIPEKVFLIQGKNKKDISLDHCIVCHKPFMIALWTANADISHEFENAVSIQVEKNGNTQASMNIQFVQKNKLEHNTIFLYQIKKAKNWQLNIIYQYFLLKQFHKKSKNAFQTGKIFSALYAYPRKVIIVSYKDNAYYNIFPMDFQGYVKESNIFLLGLRTTNITLDKILESKKVVVSDIGDVNADIVYTLGAHHSTTPPATLSFQVTSSEKYKFPVPDFCNAYKEIEIIGFTKLGSHVLMMGRVINQITTHSNNMSLYHLHLFEHLS